MSLTVIMEQVERRRREALEAIPKRPKKEAVPYYFKKMRSIMIGLNGKHFLYGEIADYLDTTYDFVCTVIQGRANVYSEEYTKSVLKRARYKLDHEPIKRDKLNMVVCNNDDLLPNSVWAWRKKESWK